MMTNDTNIDQYIKSFIDGTITQEHLNDLKLWVGQSDKNRRYASDMAELIFSYHVSEDPTTYDVESAIARFEVKVGNGKIIEGKKVNIGMRVIRLLSKRHLVAAAAILLILVLPFCGYYWGLGTIKKQFARISVSVPEGSQMHTVLPDGTEVDLNAGARLTYSQGFGITDRNVALEGEALFKVSHDSEKSFTVITKGMHITDVGTIFKARNFKDETYATVDLIKGCVDVLSPKSGSQYRMKVGERVSINKETGSMRHYTDEAAILNTDINSLNFIDTPVDEMARQLSRSYGAKIIVEPSARNIRFYGFFNRKEQSLKTILKAISMTGLVQYKINNGTYVLYK